jgi:DNA-binding CsgD family transcriptional regulator
MSATALAPAPTDALTFERPAELVEISERLYHGMFAVGLWAAVGCTAFAIVDSMLQPAGNRLPGVLACLLCLGAVSLAAHAPAPLYHRLRRTPSLLLVPGGLLGLAALIVGPDNLALLVPSAAIIGVIGIAAPLRTVLAAAALAAGGLAASRLVAGHDGYAGALVVVVLPVMFWLIVDRIAGFALRLQQSLDATSGQPPVPVGAVAFADAESTPVSTPPRRRKPRALSAPRYSTIDGVRLSSRQLQVVLLACEGLRHKEIGACLGIGAAQVRRHLENARARTGSASTPQLVAWAQRSGLVPRVT